MLTLERILWAIAIGFWTVVGLAALLLFCWLGIWLTEWVRK